MLGKSTTDVRIELNMFPETGQPSDTTGDPPETAKTPQEATDEPRKRTGDPSKTTEDPPKTIGEPSNGASLSKLGQIGSFKKISGETSNTEAGDSLEDRLFKPFGDEFKRDQLFSDIKESFDEHMETLGINDEYLRGIENGKILAEHVAEEFQSLDSEKRDLLFLWASFVKRYDLLEPFYNINANIRSTIPDIGYNALHVAAFSECAKSCKWLISKGLDLDLTVGGVSPLHCAVMVNSLECTKLLLSAGATLDNTVLDFAFEDHATHCLQHLLNEYVKNALDENSPTPHAPADRGMVKCLQIMKSYFPEADLCATTPLHLAAGNNLFECCQFLITGGDDPNAVDHKGQTALHFAAKARSSECLRILLKAGCDVNAKAVTGRTPLHLVVSGWDPCSSALDALKLLVKKGADVNASDNLGITPLHLAADKSIGIRDPSQCVDYLIMSGANVTALTHAGVTALSFIRQKTPGSVDAICRKLDSSIVVSRRDPSDKQNVGVVFNFSYLLHKSTEEHMRFLKTLEREGQKHLIEHPLCQAFLHLHWKMIRKFYFCRIFSSFVLVTLLTAYVIFALAHDCRNAAVLTKKCKTCLNDAVVLNKPAISILTEDCKMCLNRLTNSNDVSKNISTGSFKMLPNNLLATANMIVTETSQKCLNNSGIGSFFIEQPLAIPSISYTLVLMAILESIRKIFIMLCVRSNKFHFFKLENVLEWFVILSVFLVSYSHQGRIYDWQLNVGGIAVLLAWTGFMIMIGQLPVLGSYVTMFTRIQSAFFRLLLIYSCLLIGFTASFCVFFPSKDTFRNPLVGFIKILVMMTGESDFEIIEENLSSKPASLLNISAYIIYILFLMFVTVVLMTLLTSIAVHDIAGLHKTACLSKSIRQMELIYFLEIAIHRGFLPERIVKLSRKLLWQQSSFDRDILSFSLLQNRLPKEILLAALNLAEQREKWTKPTSCWANAVRNSPNSISNQEEDISEELQQLKDTVYNLMENNCNNFTEIIKNEKNLHEELWQLKEMIRAQNGNLL